MQADRDLRRAQTLAEFRQMMGLMITPQGVQQGLRLQLEPTDVVISPFGKCGTTWLQQLVHSLRTGGDLDFDDISRVVPWIETSTDLGLDLAAPQRARPRAFKSHLPWEAVPKGGRYIVALRDPRDALVSMYRFMEGWFLEPGCVGINEFAREHYLRRDEGRDYWTHFASWWRRRADPAVLLLAYEQMKQDLPGTIRRVAAFLEIPLTDELATVVAREASLESMAAHRDRYDDRLMRERSEAVAGLPPGSDSTKVRSGRVGSHREELDSALIAELDQIWCATIEPEFGLPDYAALVDALGAQRGPR